MSAEAARARPRAGLGPRRRAIFAAAFAILCALSPAALAAEDAAKDERGAAAALASVTISWGAAKGAGGYTVELATLDGEAVTSVTVEAATATLSAPPGDYLLRVVSLNNFMRPESASPWRKISIVRKGKPRVDLIEPAFVEPGVRSRVVLSGKNLDASTAVTIRRAAGGAAIKPLSVRALGSGRIELTLPPMKEIGSYSLQLLNKPDYSLKLPDALVVRHRSAVVASVEPSSLELGEKRPLFAIAGADFAPGAKLRLEGPQGGAALSIVSRSETGLVVEVDGEAARTLNDGSYDLVIENDALSVSRAEAALRLYRTAPPAVAASPAAAAAAAEGATAAAAPTAAAAAPAPTPAPIAAVAPPSAAVVAPTAPAAVTTAPIAATTPSPVASQEAAAPASAPAAVTTAPIAATTPSPVASQEAAAPASAPAAAPTAASAPEAAVIAPPASEAPAAEAAPAPDTTAVAPPAAAAAADETAAVDIKLESASPRGGLPENPWSAAAGWSTAFALGDWADILAPSLKSANLEARLCLAERKGRSDAVLRTGAALGLDASFLATKPDESTYVDSSLAILGLEAGAWAAMAWPKWEASLRAGAGAAYSSLRVSDSNAAEDATKAVSALDFAASASLELAWKPSDRLAIGLRARGSLVLYTDRPLAALSPGFFARLAF
jgi:hypothetical protein